MCQRWSSIDESKHVCDHVDCENVSCSDDHFDCVRFENITIWCY